MKEHLKEARQIAQILRTSLLSVGVKASVLYKLEQIIKICKEGEQQQEKLLN